MWRSSDSRGETDVYNTVAMRTVAILGAGELGGVVARTLADGDTVSCVRLIDPEARTVAAGKALDIRQAGPIEGFDTRVEGFADEHAFAGADLIVLADRHDGSAWAIDGTLDLLRRVTGLAPRAPLLFAGADHRDLMAAVLQAGILPPARLVGSAPAAAAAAVRALTAPLLDASPTDIAVPVLGLPPSWVLAWSHATAAGAPADGLPGFEQARVERMLAASWPPGAYSLASAAAMVARAMLTSSRRRASCFAAVPTMGPNRTIVGVPVLLNPSGVARIAVPDLAPRERVALETVLYSGL